MLEQQSAETHPKPIEHPNRQFAIGLGRAFAGATLFALPLFMTMEMWWLGYYMSRGHLALLLLLNIPLLIGLAYYSGFEETFDMLDVILDAFAAYGVGFLAAGTILLLLAILKPDMTTSEIIGKIALQAVPGSIGALLARSIMVNGTVPEKQRREQAGYWGELFFMLGGALFLSLNLAPTEEIMLMAFQMSAWHALIVALVSLVVIHAFVYSLKFEGGVAVPEKTTPTWSLFLRFTVVGYALSLLASLFMLWIFGRMEGTGFITVLMMATVLGFPAAIGGAAARLIL
jgi:putative integral membrane protein (TIGR02587 family)